MKEFFIGLVTGAVLMAFTGWYYSAHKSHTVRHAQDATASAIQDAVHSFEAKLVAWHLTNKDIDAELTAKGKVVRHSMSDFGSAIADAASDTRVTAKVKAKLSLDKELSGFGISVNTTDGRVTLSGNVPDSKQIGRAMMLTLETEGVREVSSTLKVKPNGAS